jgi:hypothetical protein
MATITTSVTINQGLNGYVERSINAPGESFSTIRAGAGTDSGYTSGNNGVEIAGLFATNTTNSYLALERVILLFDTSALPSNSTVTSASLNLYFTEEETSLGTTSLVVVASTPASNSSLIASDYANLGSVSFGSIAQTSITFNSLNVISLNSSGIAAVTPGGMTKLGCVLGWDFNNSFTGTWASTSNTYIEWSSAALSLTYTNPALSITGISSLSNVSTITTA